MRSVKYVILGSVVLGVLAFVAGSSAEEKKEEKPLTIKDVMKLHEKEGVHDKVIAGTASDEEKSQLIVAYTALNQSKPPMGNEKEWKELTDKILVAAKKGDTKELETLTNCKACHTKFKKPKPK